MIEVDDLEAALDAVLDAGGTLAKPIFAFPGGRRFHFLDPGGNELACVKAGSSSAGRRPTGAAARVARAPSSRAARSPNVIARPPVRASRSRSARSQRGLQPRGSRRSEIDDVGPGAGARPSPARRRDAGVRVARMRQRRPLAIDIGGAQILAARDAGQVVELDIIGLRRGQLGQRVADIVAGPPAQDRQPAVRSAQRDMAAVAGDEQVGQRRRQRPERSGHDRDQAQPPPARPPQAEPQAARDHQRESAARHRRQHRHRAGRSGGRVRDPQQQRQRLPGQPPERRAEPDQIEQQRQRLERHDDEGGQRDRDDVGAGAVEPGPVEMEQRDRRQRDLDRRARSAPARAGSARPAPSPPSSRRDSSAFDARMLVQRDDRDDRREAQLEARPDQPIRARAAARSARPTATSRSVIASRPSAIPASTSKAAMQERTVGTSAPVSSV